MFRGAGIVAAKQIYVWMPNDRIVVVGKPANLVAQFQDIEMEKKSACLDVIASFLPSGPLQQHIASPFPGGFGIKEAKNAKKEQMHTS